MYTRSSSIIGAGIRVYRPPSNLGGHNVDRIFNRAYDYNLKNPMACTNYIGTLNNPTEVPHEFLERLYTQLKAKYVCG